MTVCNSRCVKPAPHHSIQHCTVCHRTFSSTTSGDAHRVPLSVTIDSNGARRPADWRRRCLQDQEMIAIGMYPHPKTGVWHSPKPTEKPSHWRVQDGD